MLCFDHFEWQMVLVAAVICVGKVAREIMQAYRMLQEVSLETSGKVNKALSQPTATAAAN